jgi:hypothetical protein
MTSGPIGSGQPARHILDRAGIDIGTTEEPLKAAGIAEEVPSPGF